MRYFSPSTGCTYLQGVHAVFPDDAVKISEAVFLSVIAEPAAGKVRAVDPSGMPILIDAPKPSQADIAQQVYAAQTQLINQACEAAITAGFTSVALGEPHFYGSQLEDQLNLNGILLADQDSLYPCRDELGSKLFRPHTAKQLRQVGGDFTVFKLQLLHKADQLKQQLDQALVAIDVAAMQVITWEAPL